MSENGYQSVSDFRGHLQEERLKGISRGHLLGWKGWRDSFSIVPGSTLYIYGPPFSGKSTLKHEILRQLSEYYGWNHMIFDPETGDLPVVSSTLVKNWTGKDLITNYGNQMTRAEMIAAEVDTSGHYFLLDAMAKRWTIDDCWDALRRAQDKTKKKIHTISIDPFNYMKHDKRAMGAYNWADYLEEFLPEFIRTCRKEDVYGIIVTHLRDQDQRSRKIDGQMYYYYPPGTPREIAGGQVWYRMGMSMISIWQPPDWWVDEHGIPKSDYEVHVFFDKKKPDGVSEPGDMTKMTKMYWDYRSKRYFEKNDYGAAVYPSKPQSEAEKINIPDAGDFGI